MMGLNLLMCNFVGSSTGPRWLAIIIKINFWLVWGFLIKIITILLGVWGSFLQLYLIFYIYKIWLQVSLLGFVLYRFYVLIWVIGAYIVGFSACFYLEAGIFVIKILIIISLRFYWAFFCFNFPFIAVFEESPSLPLTFMQESMTLLASYCGILFTAAVGLVRQKMYKRLNIMFDDFKGAGCFWNKRLKSQT